jgi:hypothetical protein
MFINFFLMKCFQYFCIILVHIYSSTVSLWDIKTVIIYSFHGKSRLICIGWKNKSSFRFYLNLNNFVELNFIGRNSGIFYKAEIVCIENWFFANSVILQSFKQYNWSGFWKTNNSERRIIRRALEFTFVIYISNIQ